MLDDMPAMGPGRFSVEPPRERPDSPPEGYGVPRTGGEFIDWVHVIDRLTTAEGYWLGTVTPDHRPHVVPIWGCFVAGDLYLETGDPNTIKNRNLRANPNVFVHLDDVNDVVLIRGTAVEIAPSRRLGEALAAAMGGKYSGYDPTPDSWDHGGMWRIEPEAVIAWTTMPTASRWRFGRG
ncbi:MAG TPA: pyridoxamine 5'-phosphate oxidase family protein [Candidatus Binatia bacterium]|nr:pyridoxamine 5'-phosphate oxidase family protein [Candidatus Binatia bacterium]